MAQNKNKKGENIVADKGQRVNPGQVSPPIQPEPSSSGKKPLRSAPPETTGGPKRDVGVAGAEKKAS
jgi:hypothetical protein